MDVTPRELVRQTLEFSGPARLPRQLWVLPWAEHHHPTAVAELRRRFPDDIVSCPTCLTQPPTVQGNAYEPGTYVDEWGCRFENVQRGIIGEVRTPLLADWSSADAVRIPEQRLSVDVERVNDFCRQTDRFVLAGCAPRLFERLQFLRGTENLFRDLARGHDELTRLMNRIHAFYLKELELWAATEVDALMIMDDWGSQRAMLISPASWRRLFRPVYEQYIQIAHDHGKPMFMHSDGYILDILPDLVELGLDAINCQVACMDPTTLGEHFAGKITFWGELDRQQLLPTGAPDEVIAAAREMKMAFHRNGGFIAQCEFGPGARPENVIAAFETWSES